MRSAWVLGATCSQTTQRGGHRMQLIEQRLHHENSTPKTRRNVFTDSSSHSGTQTYTPVAAVHKHTNKRASKTHQRSNEITPIQTNKEPSNVLTMRATNQTSQSNNLTNNMPTKTCNATDAVLNQPDAQRHSHKLPAQVNIPTKPCACQGP